MTCQYNSNNCSIQTEELFTNQLSRKWIHGPKKFDLRGIITEYMELVCIEAQHLQLVIICSGGACIMVFRGAAWASFHLWHSASCLSSFVVKPIHVSLKDQSSLPSLQVTLWKICIVSSVCIYNFASPCQCASINRSFRPWLSWDCGRRPVKTRMAHYKVMIVL